MGATTTMTRHCDIRITILAASVLACGASGNAALWRVPSDLPTIGDGIAAATTGDTVLVAPGLYLETINLHGKAITLRSEGGPDHMVIDAQGAGSVLTCNSGETPESVIEGFTLTGGYAVNGGGLFLLDSSPRLHHLIAKDNDATADGGGMHIAHGNPDLKGVLLIANRAQRGAGLFAIDGIYSLDDLLADSNQATGDGGGVWISRGTLVLRRPILEGNRAASGAGVVADNGNLEIYGGQISDNEATLLGGGLHSRCAQVTLADLRVARNHAVSGGGLSLTDGQISFDRVAVLNNLAEEQGGGLHMLRAPLVALQSTIHGNAAPAGSGIHAVDQHLTLSSSLVTQNRDGAGIDVLRVVTALSHNDVWANEGGNYAGLSAGPNDICIDPRYVAPSWGDYRLLWRSPAIDGGDPAARRDPDGTRADMGATPFDQSDALELYLSSHRRRVRPGDRIQVLHTTINTSDAPIQVAAQVTLGLPGGGETALRELLIKVEPAGRQGYSTQRTWSATIPWSAPEGQYEYRVDLGDYGVSRLPLFVDR